MELTAARGGEECGGERWPAAGDGFEDEWVDERVLKKGSVDID